MFLLFFKKNVFSLRSKCAAARNVLLRRICMLCASAEAAHWSEATTLHEVHHITRSVSH